MTIFNGNLDVKDDFFRVYYNNILGLYKGKWEIDYTFPDRHFIIPYFLALSKIY